MEGRPPRATINVKPGDDLSPQRSNSTVRYFESAIYGDPVEVTGTSVQLSADDGDIYDWALSWDHWKALAVN